MHRHAGETLIHIEYIIFKSLITCKFDFHIGELILLPDITELRMFV